MRKFLMQFFAFFCLVPAVVSFGQSNSATRIYSVPDGLSYRVDGKSLTGASAAVWQTGTRHTLSADLGQSGAGKTQYKFVSWQYGPSGGVLPGGTDVTVTSDPKITDLFVTYSTQHALSIYYQSCPSNIPCQSPGTITVGSDSYRSDAELWLDAGASVQLTASPADGYVFLGWEPGENQVIQGFVNTITMRSPTIARPRFQLARRINLATEPPGLDLYSDHGVVKTPITQDWAFGSTHSLGVPSPQMDEFGRWWVFSKWSDGGAENHSYTVRQDGYQDTVTATLVPATVIDVKTSPLGLPVKVDGRDNWPSYFFPWAGGEIHHIEAPDQLTDDKGRLWKFASWSNGAPRVQDYSVPPSDAPGSTVHITATYTAVARLLVTSAVPGLTIAVDGAECATPCDVQRPIGSMVRVSAPASIAVTENSRSDFDGWPGSGSLSPDWTFTLGPDPVTPRLTYRRMNRLIAGCEPADGASWRMDPPSPDSFYDATATVSVTANPRPGFRFRRWSGDANGSAPTTSLPMDAPRMVQAVFDRIPYITPDGVANAAGATPAASVAPGSIVSIFGASFAPDTLVGPDTPLSQTLGCVTVRLGDRILPLFFVSPSQINVQLPEDTPAGERRLIVGCQGMPDVEAVFTVARNSPGLFQDAHAAATAIHQDGSPVNDDSPAQPGELVTVFGTGFGPSAPARPFGLALASPAPVVDTVSVVAGDTSTPADSAYAVSGRIGVDAVQFRIPPAASSGPLSLRVTAGGVDSNTVTLRVRN